MFECLTCHKDYLLQDGHCVEHCIEDFRPNESEDICVFNRQGPIFYVLAPIIVEYTSLYVINGTVIRVVDVDTPPRSVSIMIKESPSNGYLYKIVKGDDLELRDESLFTLEDMLDGKIYYKHVSDKSFYGEMKLIASDGQYQSDVATIAINVISSFGPEIIKNEPLIVKRGGEAYLDNKVLQIHDDDSLQSVSVKILDGPYQGLLTIENDDLVLFSLDELNKGVLKYTNTPTISYGVNNTKDSGTDIILLQATDGHSVHNFLVRVVIVDSSHPQPVILKNRGANVRRGNKVQITKNILQATDIDSEDENLVFSLLPTLDNPAEGNILV